MSLTDTDLSIADPSATATRMAAERAASTGVSTTDLRPGLIAAMLAASCDVEAHLLRISGYLTGQHAAELGRLAERLRAARGGVPTSALAPSILAETRDALKGMVDRCRQCGGTGRWKLGGQLAKTADSMPCLDCEAARAVLAKLAG